MLGRKRRCGNVLRASSATGIFTVTTPLARETGDAPLSHGVSQFALRRLVHGVNHRVLRPGLALTD